MRERDSSSSESNEAKSGSTEKHWISKKVLKVGGPALVALSYLSACGGGSEAENIPQPTATIEQVPTIFETPSPFPTLTPEATFTSEPTTIPTEAPATAEPTPPSPETQRVLDRLYDIGWAEKFGNATFAVTKGMQERTGCLDPRDNYQTMLPCSSVESIALNLEDFPDAIDKQNEGINHFYYTTWKEQNNSDITYEEYKNKVDSGEQLFIEVVTRGEDKIMKKSQVNVNDGITFVFVEDDKNMIVSSNLGNGFGFRVDEGGLIIEMHDWQAGGAGNTNKDQGNPSEYFTGVNLATAFAIMSDQPFQEKLSTLLEGYMTVADFPSNINKKMNEFFDYFVPYYDGATLGTSTEATGIYIAEGVYRPTIIR